MSYPTARFDGQMLLLKKKSSKREKRHGAWPYLKTVKDHDDAVAPNTECVVLV